MSRARTNYTYIGWLHEITFYFIKKISAASVFNRSPIVTQFLYGEEDSYDHDEQWPVNTDFLKVNSVK